MTIDDAIQILSDAAADPGSVEDPELPEAARLGIEALKREEERREYKVFRIPTLLPGETPGETKD